MAIPKEELQNQISVYLEWVAEFTSRNVSRKLQDELAAIIAEFEAAAKGASGIDQFMKTAMEKKLHERAADCYSRSFLEQQAAKTAAVAAAGEEAGGDPLAKTFAMHIEYMKQKRAEAQADAARGPEVPIYDRMVQLYEGGISYPAYLKACEEEGLSERLSMYGMRQLYVDGVAGSRETLNKPVIDMYEELLAEYDRAAAATPHGVPDQVLWEIRDHEVRMKYMPLKVSWDTRCRLWWVMLSHTLDWIDSHTRFAPMDLRWCIPGMPDDEIRTNILFTQDVSPGYSAVYEAITKEYFGFDFDGIFGEETFLYELEARKTFPCRMPLSDDRLAFLREARKHMVPMKKPPAEIVARAEELYQKSMKEKGSIDASLAKYQEALAKLPKEERERLMERQPPSGMGPGSTLSSPALPGENN